MSNYQVRRLDARRTNRRVAGCIALALWLLVGTFALVAFYLDSGAVTAAIGTGFWAVIATVVWIGLATLPTTEGKP